MKIKSNGEQYLLEPEALMQIAGITSDKYAIANTSQSTLRITELKEDLLDPKWTEIEEDRRKLKKLKKTLLSSFAKDKMTDYKETDLIYNTLKKKFINVSEISDVLKNSLKNEMNLIIYGRGGFGKSEMITELFSGPEFKNSVYIKSLSEATTEEDLFGGINIKKMTDSGIIEYNCENSFANFEIVIFEEIFDANPRVLAALKDTLTAKEIRNGIQRFPIKSKIIIGLTNKTYEEVIVDDSTEALTQRFPISYKLDYEITDMDIMALAINKYPELEPKKLMGIIEWGKTTIKNKITPRKVLELAKYLNGITINEDRKYSEMVTNNSMEAAIEYIQKKKEFDKEVLNLELKMQIEKSRGRIEKNMTYFDEGKDINQKIEIISRKLAA